MTLNIASFNAWQMGPLLSKDNNERLEMLAKNINENKYDIINLQEMWRKKDIEKLKKLLNPVNKEKYDFYNLNSNKKNTSGLMIISLHEIKEKNFLEYEANSLKILEPAKKGILSCVINVDDNKINIYNTHLALNSKLYLDHAIKEITGWELDINKQSPVQKSQTNQLKEYVNTKSSILSGDFNTFSNYKDVVPDNFKIVSQTSESTRVPTNKYAGYMFNLKVNGFVMYDMIMATNDFEKVSNSMSVEPKMSDHYLIQAMVRKK